MRAHWKKYTLQFKQASGTSRGILRTKDSYFIILEEKDNVGIGECGILRGLSADDTPDYEDRLDRLVREIEEPFDTLYEELKEYPSIQFGLEMALKDLNAKDHILFPGRFTEGEALQPINGLLWMGDISFMMDQLKQRLENGFSVIKMKIGALNFQDELDVLNKIRKEFSPSDIEIRVDANGAFTTMEAKQVLNQLAELSVHSIEQPIRRGQWEAMAELCELTPVSIALDEELIGVFDWSQRTNLLKVIKPQYIILKPSFIGGFRGSEHWIEEANKMDIGWWVTSALESNIGLSAIAQWNSTLNNPMPSGLGTGSLYTNNFNSPLYIEKGHIGYDPERKWIIGL